MTAVTLLTHGSVLFLRLGLFLRVVAFRRELTNLDNGTLELWGNRYGLDEEGCVCSEAACSQRFLDEDA